MLNNKLSNNEMIVLRLLYSKQVTSSQIPKVFFDVAEKDNLVSLGLIALKPDNEYVLTEKAINVIETDAFIIKYPLATEKGTVLNYKDVLNNMSSSAARALGLSVINTDFHKKWGKQTNTLLYDKLKETMLYYRDFNHPLSIIYDYEADVIKADEAYSNELHKQLARVDSIVIMENSDINLVDLTTGETLKLISYHPINKIQVLNSKKELELIDLEIYDKVRLTDAVKKTIVVKYWKDKSNN